MASRVEFKWTFFYYYYYFNYLTFLQPLRSAMTPALTRMKSSLLIVYSCFFCFFLATSNEAKYLLLKKKKPWSICYRKDSERSGGEYYLPDICSSSLSPLHTEQIKEGIKPSVSGDAAAAGPKINCVNSPPPHLLSFSSSSPPDLQRRKEKDQEAGLGSGVTPQERDPVSAACITSRFNLV